MLDDDLAVFFDEDGFARACSRDRPGEDGIEFSGILTTSDVEQFDGVATLGRHRLHFPTSADVRAGDTLTTTRRTQEGGALPAETWRVVRDPERVLDGATSVAYLKPVLES